MLTAIVTRALIGRDIVEGLKSSIGPDHTQLRAVNDATCGQHSAERLIAAPAARSCRERAAGQSDHLSDAPCPP